MILKGLEDMIGISFAGYPRGNQGWWYETGLDEFQPVDGRLLLHRIYTASDPACTSRVTTPTLWDRTGKKIVSNESSDILRMLNTEFQGLGATDVDLYPEHLRDEIDSINEQVYANLNNGVYRCGFASSQEAYNEAFASVFDVLDMLESRLGRHRYLAGDRLTEADLRAFPTLVRFDAVYYSHFKCNLRRIIDYPNLSQYLRDLYQTRGFGETVSIDLYKQGYYSIGSLNPSGIVPQGPQLDFDAPHDRAERTYDG